MSRKSIEALKQRNKYYAVKQEEISRKATTDGYTSFYKKTFITNPVLVLKIANSNETPVLLSYDMNSTFSFGKLGIIYTTISCSTPDSMMFGSFKTIGETSIGKSGILITSKFDKMIFPKPLKIEGNIITGENYEILLNKGWRVIAMGKKGNLEIVKE